MSSSDSNLSSIDYDMVIGLTQNSINSTMKRYMDSLENNSLEPICYVYTDDSLTAVEAISYQELLNRTTSDDFPNGVDPFSIPDGTTQDDSDPTLVAEGFALYNALFAFGFSATMGIPEPIDTTDEAGNETTIYPPDIILLEVEGKPQEVTYQMYFKTFQIVQQISGRNSWTQSNIQQPEGAPWIYQWIACLGIDDADFNALPQAKQDAIKNLDNSSAFSVQQLLLDLNIVPIYDASKSETNAFSSSPQFLNYLNQYWEILKVNDIVSFASAVQPTNSSPTIPSLIPTDLNFVVTPYNSTSEDTDNSDLATLNYLVMANDNSMPSPIAPIPWTWLNASEDKSYDGVMAVKKNNFVSYLNDLLSPSLKNMCIQPTVDMEKDFGDRVEYKWGYDIPNVDRTYNPINNASDLTHVLSFSYTSTTSEDDIFGIGSASIWSSFKSDIHLEGSTIICINTACIYIDIGLVGVGNLDISHTRGYILAQTNTTTFTMTVDNNGQLSVTMDEKVQDLTQDTDKDSDYYDGDLDPSWFAEMASYGNIDDMVDEINDYSSAMSDALSNYDQGILELLNTLNTWVFPGAGTFTYKNCCFSDFQDLTTMIKYASVS